MSTWAAKSIIAFRILLRELGFRRSPPTPLEVDAAAITQGVQMEHVSRQQRFQAARLAMMRQWVDDGIISLVKTDTRYMRADILTKPLNPGSDYRAKQSLLLAGTDAQARDGVAHIG